MISTLPLATTTRHYHSKEAYVLLVDDHEPTLVRLDALITHSGHACVSARSGSEAIAYYDQRRPKVVVTDMSMPNLDGLALARWLQARHPSVPIILLTAQRFDRPALDEMRHTFIAVLSKPVVVEKLLGWIDRLMPGPSISKRRSDSGRP